MCKLYYISSIALDCINGCHLLLLLSIMFKILLSSFQMLEGRNQFTNYFKIKRNFKALIYCNTYNNDYNEIFYVSNLFQDHYLS